MFIVHFSMIQLKACPDCQQFFAGGSKVSDTHWTENSRSSRVLKVDIPSVIDVNENKHVCKQEVN